MAVHRQAMTRSTLDLDEVRPMVDNAQTNGTFAGMLARFDGPIVGLPTPRCHVAPPKNWDKSRLHEVQV
eukprot:scaffold89242_cov35-Tisochrysis_lutea.AAC.2